MWELTLVDAIDKIGKADSKSFQVVNDALVGKKVKDGSKKGGYAKRNSEIIKEREEAWQQEANRIWEKNPNASKVFVVNTIIKRFHKEKKDNLLRGKEHIRKKIKNPHQKKW